MFSLCSVRHGCAKGSLYRQPAGLRIRWAVRHQGPLLQNNLRRAQHCRPFPKSKSTARRRLDRSYQYAVDTKASGSTMEVNIYDGTDFRVIPWIAWYDQYEQIPLRGSSWHSGNRQAKYGQVSAPAPDDYFVTAQGDIEFERCTSSSALMAVEDYSKFLAILRESACSPHRHLSWPLVLSASFDRLEQVAHPRFFSGSFWAVQEYLNEKMEFFFGYQISATWWGAIVTLAQCIACTSTSNTAIKDSTLRAMSFHSDRKGIWGIKTSFPD